MEASNVCLVFVLAVLFGNGLTSNICDDERCNCSPNEQPTSVRCNCNGFTQTLDFYQQHFDTSVERVSTVNISNCNQVNFNTYSFKNLNNMETVSVNEVGTAIFQYKVFQFLSNLRLQQIQSLDFKLDALAGLQNLENLVIDGSSIQQLLPHSFYDMNHFRSLSLTNTYVNVKANAIYIHTTRTDSSVTFDKSVIRNVEENGINIKANTITIKDSTISQCAPNSINIDAKNYISITHSRVNSSINNNAFHIAAPNVTISNNVFDHLSTEILANINSKKQGKVVLTNNTVRNLVLEMFGDKIISAFQDKETRHNRFHCTCEFVDYVGSLPRDFFDNNFCLADCDVPMNSFYQLVEKNDTCDPHNPESLDELVNLNCPNPTDIAMTAVPVIRHTREEKYTRNIAMMNFGSSILTLFLATIIVFPMLP